MWPGSSSPAVVNGAAGLIIAALLIAGLYAGQEILIPLALAGLLGFVLAPLVRRLEGWGLPNGLAVPAVIVVLLAALFGGATITGRELAQLLVQVQRAARRTGVGGGIAFEDGDGVTVAVQDAGEAKAGGAGSNHSDTMAHGNTLYFDERPYRNCTMHA